VRRLHGRPTHVLTQTGGAFFSLYSLSLSVSLAATKNIMINNQVFFSPFPWNHACPVWESFTVSRKRTHARGANNPNPKWVCGGETKKGRLFWAVVADAALE